MLIWTVGLLSFVDSECFSGSTLESRSTRLISFLFGAFTLFALLPFVVFELFVLVIRAAL